MVFLSVLAGPAVVADPAGWVSHAGHAKLAGNLRVRWRYISCPGEEV